MKRIIIATTLAVVFIAASISLTRGIEVRASASNAIPVPTAQGLPTVSINDVSLAEGNAGTSNMVFTVTLTASISHPTIGISYTTADGPPPSGATAPLDYASASGMLLFPPASGNDTRTISVPINGDTSAEPDETFFVNLSLIDGGAIISDGQGVGTIINDDSAPGNCPPSISPTIRGFAAVGGTGTVTVIAGAGCGWVAVSNDSWITITSEPGGAGNGTINYSVAANSGNARFGTMTIADQTFRVEQRPGQFTDPCTPPSIQPPLTREFSASGGPDRAFVFHPIGCNWTAVSNDPWITITLNWSAREPAGFRYLVGANTGPARTGTITVIGDGGNATLTVNQQEAGRGCIYSITPTSIDLPNSTEPFGEFEGSITVDTQFGCEWTAVSNDPWIEIIRNPLEVGSDRVGYRVRENTDIARTGTITIAGHTFTVRQARCPITLETTRSDTFSYVGGTGTIRLSSHDCPLTIISNDPWITITSVDAFDESIEYAVAQNPGAFRTGTVTINDLTYTVAQFSGGSCDLSLDRTIQHFSASGTGGIFSAGFNVITPGGCPWSARSNASWVHILTGATGSGNGEVLFTVDLNLGPMPRFTTIRIKDEAVGPDPFPDQIFTIEQDQITSCVQEVSPAHKTFDGNENDFTVEVTATPDCRWEAITEASWIKITDIGLHSGSRSFSYSIDENPGGQRTGVINFGGKLHTVTQGVGGCPVEFICQLSPSQCELEVSQARGFRDRVLSRTSRGQPYTQLYYKFSTEAVGIMMLNPSLILRSREMMDRYMPVIRSMVRGEQVSLTEGDIEEIDGFLRTFAEKGSPELRETIKGLCEDLSNPQVHSEFNITITRGPKRELSAQAGSLSFMRTGLMITPLGICLFCLYRKRSTRKNGAKTTLKRLSCVAIVFSMVSGTGNLVAGRAVNGRTRITRSPLSTAKLKEDKAARASETNGRLPLSFEANQGQFDSDVKFISRGAGYNLYLTSTEAVMAFGRQSATGRIQQWNPLQSTAYQQPLADQNSPPAADHKPQVNDVLRMKLVGANPLPRIRGIDETATRANYFIGSDRTKWRAGVPAYAKVKYENIYKGIDLIYYGNGRELEYDFKVAPGADPAAIRLGFEGAESVEVDPNGDLMLRVAGGEVRQQKPVAYQESGGARRAVTCSYGIRNRAIEFEVGVYDRSKPLIIDPVLAYSTYFGGSGNEEGNSIAVDSAGNVYVTGFTDSIDFPLANASQPGGRQDAFVVKLDSSGTRVLYSTYIGGGGQDNGTSIAVDRTGSAYITGFTDSADFPMMNALQPSNAGAFNAFVMKLSASGSPVYSTYLGGSASDYGSSLAIDPAGNIYVAGLATSQNFPVANAIQPSYGGFVDVYVAKLNPAGSQLLYSTYLGGTSIDGAASISVDSAGNAYITGMTSSPDFRTVNPMQADHGGGMFDAFVTKLNPSGAQIIYSTFLGGSGEDRAFRIALDSEGNAYVTGDTDSTNFPVANGLQPDNGGSADAFVAKLNESGSALVYSTYLGGSGIEGGTAIAVDSVGSAHVTGFTTSNNLPTAAALQTSLSGSFDGFVAKLTPNGGALDYSTYLGGSGIDSGFGIAVNSGNAYVMGLSDSTNFPVRNALQPAIGGGTVDLFIARISSNLAPDCSQARPSTARLWPPNHSMAAVSILGVTDPDGDTVAIRIDRISQDEPTSETGDGNTCPDGQGIGDPIAQLRAERSGNGNGRVYTIFFTATDGRGGSCQGSVKVCVPHSQNAACVDDGPVFDSTVCSRR